MQLLARSIGMYMLSNVKSNFDNYAIASQLARSVCIFVNEKNKLRHD
jgi:hypothetical protein